MPKEPFDFYKELEGYNFLDKILFDIVRTNMAESGPGGSMDYGTLGNFIVGHGGAKYALPARMDYNNAKVRSYIDNLGYSPQVKDKLSEFSNKRVTIDADGRAVPKDKVAEVQVGSVPFQNLDYVRRLAAELSARPENMNAKDRLDYNKGEAAQTAAGAQQQTAENEGRRIDGQIEAEIQRLEAEILATEAKILADAESEKRAAESAYDLAKIKADQSKREAELQGQNMTNYANAVNKGRMDMYKLQMEQYNKDRRQDNIYNALDSVGDFLQQFR